MVFIFLVVLFLLVDIYLYQAVLTVSRDWSPFWKGVWRYGYWIPTVFCLLVLGWWFFSDPYRYNMSVRNWIVTAMFAIFLPKIFGIAVLLIEDIQRGIRWLVQFFNRGAEPAGLPGEAIPRSEFLAKTALMATSIPFGTIAYGILSGAHDYRVRKTTVYLPNLPRSFDGLTIGHISDIHCGSFYNKTAVKGGVEMLLREKPDVIFFTGDLVNNETSEVKDYVRVFDKLKAPLGVFSVTGNHDYGDYHRWSSEEAKRRNFRDLVEAHRLMGYDLLMNTHRFIEQGGERIAIIGNENWGGGRFPKYGKLDEAYRGTEEAAVKLLLSHDPSHWDAQVRPYYPDIDIMFSGHTHGFQFGVEIGDLKWSPSQYAYKQWAGLYREETQYLYVNRGFGYLGYPGRIGMPPELTIMELKRA